MLNPRSNFSRSSSRIFRMDNLSCAIDSHPLRAKGTHDIGGYPDLHADVRSSPEGGRHAAEYPAGMARNRWPACGGISGRHQAEYADVEHRIPFVTIFPASPSVLSR